MASSMKIKVATSDLLVKVESAKAKAEKDFEKAMAKYEQESLAYNAKVVESLQKATADATSGKLPKHNGSRYDDRNSLIVPVRFGYPTKPTLALGRFDKDIAILKMASDDVLAIATDDHFGSYL